METIEPWFSVEGIAQHLGVSKETIYRWLERGNIPSHRMGKLWRFKATEVDQWVMDGGAADKDALSRKPKTNTTSKD